MLAIIGWILFGLVVGIIAKLLHPGRDPGGFLATICIGVVGSFLGGLAGRALGFYGPGQTAGLIMSVLGAVLLLVICRAIAGRRAV